MYLIFLLVVHLVLGSPLGDTCCKEKMVGGVEYRLVKEGSTSGFGCLTDCIYEREDIIGPQFCFKEGDLEVICEDHGFGTCPCIPGGYCPITPSAAQKYADFAVKSYLFPLPEACGYGIVTTEVQQACEQVVQGYNYKMNFKLMCYLPGYCLCYNTIDFQPPIYHNQTQGPPSLSNGPDIDCVYTVPTPCCGNSSRIDEKCRDPPTDPFCGVGCDACNKTDCRFCGYDPYPDCNYEAELLVKGTFEDCPNGLDGKKECPGGRVPPWFCCHNNMYCANIPCSKI